MEKKKKMIKLSNKNYIKTRIINWCLVNPFV